jgi:hypothetical protein
MTTRAFTTSSLLSPWFEIETPRTPMIEPRPTTEGRADAPQAVSARPER